MTHLPHHFDCDECGKKGTCAAPCLAEHTCFEDPGRGFRFHASRQAKADAANASDARAICARRDHFLEALKAATNRADRVYVYHPAGPATSQHVPGWVLSTAEQAKGAASANARAMVCDGVIVEYDRGTASLRFLLEGGDFTLNGSGLSLSGEISPGAETDPRQIAARRREVIREAQALADLVVERMRKDAAK